MTTMTPPIRPWVMNVFAPLMHPAVALTRGRRPHAGGIAAGAGFGEPPGAPHLTADEPREELLLLLVGTEQRDVGGAQAVVRGDRERDRRTDARQFLDADAVVDRRQRGAAVVLGKLHAGKTERRQLGQEVVRELLRLVPLHDVRAESRIPRTRGPYGAAAPVLQSGESPLTMNVSRAASSGLVRFGRLQPVRRRARSRPLVGYPEACSIAARWLFLIALALLAFPSTASADITAFLGTNPTPVNRVTTGFGVGAGLVIVGFEFEYGHTRENLEELAPSLRTYMFNGLLQTPIPIAGMQFYGTAGGGVYHETLDELSGLSETNVGINVGGGVKVNLAGPLRLRFDYRIFTLQGSPRHSKPQRFYAGLNLKF